MGQVQPIVTTKHSHSLMLVGKQIIVKFSTYQECRNKANYLQRILHLSKNFKPCFIKYSISFHNEQILKDEFTCAQRAVE